MLLPREDDVESFLDSVGEISLLIDGLKAGTISPEYIDSKIAARAALPPSGQLQSEQPAGSPPGVEGSSPGDEKALEGSEISKEKQAALLRKVDELLANRARKVAARAAFDAHVAASQGAQQQLRGATDYACWDLWTPSDDEDELFANLTPSGPGFSVLERDIEQRHSRCGIL